MRRLVIALAAVAALAGTYALGRLRLPSQTGHGEGRRILYYVDPMHPAYKSDKPGVAPDCGMQLEPVYAPDVNGGQPPPSFSPQPASAIRVDGSTQKLLGMRFIPVERGSVAEMIRVVGRVVPEDTRVYSLNSGSDGFIRETWNDSVGTQVKKGQKLASYYAPEFLPAASGFLAATERLPGAVGKDGARTVPFPGALAKQGVGSVQGYVDRLRNLGMTDAQIERIAADRQLPESIDVDSPADGFILARGISPGQHFEHGMEFYRIGDLTRVWVVAEVGEKDALQLRPGNSGRIDLPGQERRLSARISESLPQTEPRSGIVKVRFEADNPGLVLRPEMLVDIEVPVRRPPAITLPVEAVVDSGEQSRVYVELSDGVVEPREVETGWRSGERVEILRGLRPGERVVAGASFLLDSESRLKPVTALAAAEQVPVKPSGPQQLASAETVKDPQCGMPVDPAKAKASGNSITVAGATYYFCSRQCKERFRIGATHSAGQRQGEGDD